MKIFKSLNKVINWFKQDPLLSFSMSIIIVMIGVGIIIRKLEYYHTIILTGALITILWTNRRYWQAQDSIFLNKIDNLYIQVVKLINEQSNETNQDGATVKKDRRLPNLINAIQASITSHYQGRKEPKNIRATILNFFRMDLSNTYLLNANLNGANLKKSSLAYADLTQASLVDANLQCATLQNTRLTGTNFEFKPITETEGNENCGMFTLELAKKRKRVKKNSNRLTAKVLLIQKILVKILILHMLDIKTKLLESPTR